jgi:undecaprenyl-diphosphatase
MTVLEAIALGIVQGITELLPISSSAHLLLAGQFLGWGNGGLAFDVALHVGSLVAVLWFFRAQWAQLVRAAGRILVQGRIETVEERRVLYLAHATIPAGIAGLLLEDLAETVVRNPAITATMLIVMGLVLWAVDRFLPRTRTIDSTRWTDALLIGFAQCLALVPGVSRSGATISAGRALGLTRADAAVFSFLLSMPITAAAAMLKVPEAIGEMGISAPLIAGVVASGLSSWAAIAVLLRYVARRSYGVFALYRIALGLLVFWLLFGRG